MIPPSFHARRAGLRHDRGRARVTMLLVAAAFAACSHGPPNAAPSPLRAADGPDLAIYRTIAESIYVRTTHRSVGIVTSVLDTSCAAADCQPLATRWGLDPLWWAAGDSSSARTARANLIARLGGNVSLAGVSEGQPMLQSIDPDSAALVIARPDTAHWTEFKAAHGGAAGFLRFSPVGFTASGHAAIVFVDWRCGPACGHTVAVALSEQARGEWRIDDMLLVRSRSGRGAPGIK